MDQQEVSDPLWECCETPRRRKCLCSYKRAVKSAIEKILHADKVEYQHEETMFGDNSEENICRLRTAFEVKQEKMQEGYIAQKVLGLFYGWEDLGTGHDSGLDIRKKNSTIIFELKNNYNTCNSGSQKAILDKLARYNARHPNTICAWGIINPKPGCKKLVQSLRHDGVEIVKIQGESLFELVFTYEHHDYSKEVVDFVKQTMYRARTAPL